MRIAQTTFVLPVVDSFLMQLCTRAASPNDRAQDAKEEYDPK